MFERINMTNVHMFGDALYQEVGDTVETKNLSCLVSDVLTQLEVPTYKNFNSVMYKVQRRV